MAALVNAAPLLAQAPTVQQRFDAAQQKLDVDDAEGALADLRALEAYLTVQSNPGPTNIAVNMDAQPGISDPIYGSKRKERGLPL